MKKFLMVVGITVVMLACKDKTATPESSPNLTNVQNVNGNQPDTTSGIELDSRKSADTSKKDTMRH